MDRTEKVLKLKRLEEAVKQKEEQIHQEKSELEKLEEECARENISELPLLLFMVDQTLPMPDDERDWEYQYIYYCPDLDDIKSVTKHKNEFLPNTVDIRKQFEYLGMPKKLFPGDACYDYYPLVKQAVSSLKLQIDELFNSNNIDSWPDLGMILTSGTPEKGQAKILKPNTIQSSKN